MKNTLRFVTLRFLSLLFIYFLIRVFYQVYNYSSFENTSYNELFGVYLSGIRFDISAILKLNALFIVIWLMPIRALHCGMASKILNFAFLFINILFITAGTADAELIHFSGQRLNFNYFLISQDIEGQMGQLLAYYWKPALITFAIALLFIKIQPSSPKEFKPLTPTPLRLAALFSILFFIGLGVRGGFQNKPLRPAHAFLYSQSELGQLALNSTFTLLQSGGKTKQTKFKFMPDEDVAQYLKRDRTPHFKNIWTQKQNVVLIIVESLSLEFIGAANNGQGYTPFIDELAAKGLLFTNAFANGRRSLEAVPSILASVPSLLNDPFVTSTYQGAKVLGLGEVLKKQGYSTAFFHGAVNGSMFFDSFSARAGFDHYYGLNEYPEKEKDYDGFWGILDEPYFQQFIREIKNQPKPFANIIFSLSSHQPYSVPEIYKGQFPKGSLEIHESLGYTDYSLRKFFESAEKETWFKDTLFIITGDHTQKSDVSAYQNELGHYRVPILLYHPGLKIDQWPSHKLTRVAQHADLLPTILDVLNVPQENLSEVGSSLFSDSNDAFVINKTPEGFWYVSNEHLIKMDLNQNIVTFNYDPLSPISEDPTKVSAPLPAGNQPEKEILRMKAYLQFFVNGLIENKLFH